MAGKVESKKLEEYKNENYYLLGDGKMRMCCHPRWPTVEVIKDCNSFMY